MAIRQCRERECDEPATNHGACAGIYCDDHAEMYGTAD